MDLLHPGVYIQEIPSGVRSIEGVSTSTGAFIGKAQMGPLNQAVVITRMSEFEANFGTFLDDSWLAHDVFQFFNNGGQRCYVVRVAGEGARAAEIAIKDRKGAASGTMVIRAISPGDWGNNIAVAVTDGTVDPDNEFNLGVFRDRSGLNPPLPPQLLENFQGLSMNPEAANYVEKVIAATSRVITAAVNEDNFATAGAGTSRGGKLPVGNGAGADVLKLGVANGGTEIPGNAGPPTTAGRSRSGNNPSTNPPADKRKFNLNLDGDGVREVTIASDAATGPDVAAATQAAVRALTANNPLRQPAYAGFTCTFQTPPGPAQPFYELVSGTTGAGSAVVVMNAMVLAGHGAALLGLGVLHGGTETQGTAGPPVTPGESRSASNPATTLPADSRKINVNLDNDGSHEIAISPAAGTGADIAAAIQSAVQVLTPITLANQPAYTNFTSTFETPAAPAPPFYRLRSGTTGVNSSVVVTDALTPLTGISLGAGTRRFNIDLNRDGPHVVALDGPLANGNAIAKAIHTAVRAILPNRSGNAAAFDGVICTYENGPGPRNPSLLLTSGSRGPDSSVRVSNSSSLTDNAAALLRLGTTNGGVEVTGQAVLRPANSRTPTEYHLGSATPTGNVVSALLGSDGLPPGDLEHKNGLTALDIVRDVNLVAIPGIGTLDVVSTGVNYCTQRADCFFIGDTNSTDVTLEDARAFINGLTVKSSFGAVYYPWLKIADPTGQSSSPILAPPSGAVMGMYARIDSRRGVWKAPAGTEANIGTASGLAADTTDAQQDFLNPIGVNVIRSFPASGIVIWGARTLATRSDPEYRYIPVRRTAIFLEQSIYNGIQFAVFEPNDEPLWASLRLNITAFMTLQFRAGAFQGRTANEAFFVKCDSSTTTQQDIDAGIVNILVGFAPLKPAEFVVLKLTQKSGQPA